MSHHLQLSGENFSHKAAATFASESSAIQAADALRKLLEPATARVNVLSPGQQHIGRALEPERKGVLLTMIRAHLWLGLFGAIAGMLLFLILSVANVDWVTQSPTAAATATIVLGTVAGLLLGGLMTLRPDHSRYVEAVRQANDEGCTVVIVHAGSDSVCAAAEQTLDRLGGQTLRTL